MRAPILAVLLLLGTTGCAASAPEAAGLEPTTRLTAALVTPTDIALEWRGTEPDVAGYTVEFATEPQGRYTILEFVPPRQVTYKHSDLMPETRFYYRVRPYHGLASREVEVTLSGAQPDERSEKDGQEWAAPRTVPGAAVAKQSIRNPGAATAAAPTDLRGTAVHADGISFTWTDHASDEEGYLLEARPDGAADFAVIAVLDPDINSFGLVTLPNEKKASYRVRAFYHGAPSNVANQKTGRDR